MLIRISFYTIVITFTDSNRVITTITWHLRKEFELHFSLSVLLQIAWISHAALVGGAASVCIAIWRISVDPDIASITLRIVILMHNTCVKLSHDAKPKGQIHVDKWRGMKNCSTCCKCLDDHHDLFEYDKNDPSNSNNKTYGKKEISFFQNIMSSSIWN